MRLKAPLIHTLPCVCHSAAFHKIAIRFTQQGAAQRKTQLDSQIFAQIVLNQPARIHKISLLLKRAQSDERIGSNPVLGYLLSFHGRTARAS